MATVKAGFGDQQIQAGAIDSPVRRIRQWTVSLRMRWLDHCTREGLRYADDNVVHEAGCRRTARGDVVPLNRR